MLIYISFQFHEDQQKIHLVMVGKAVTTAGVSLTKLRKKWIEHTAKSYEEHITVADGVMKHDIRIVLG